MGNSLARRLKPLVPWLAYVAVALACAEYLNRRANLVPKWGDWYMADGHPYTVMQLQAMLKGKLALFAHSSGAGNDYTWGRGGMHQPWGLGMPILALPFHLVARLFGAPAFPDQVRFLILYVVTTVLLARALHRIGRAEPNALGAGLTAAGFVMTFPAFVSLCAARFWIYESTIATGALWSVALLAGLVSLLYACTPRRLALVCAAAGFSTMIRIPLATYGVMTVSLALIIAHKRRLSLRALLGGIGAYAGVSALYLTGNFLRFGYFFASGYSNGIGGQLVNRLMRWGLPFAKVPFTVAAKEYFATLFLLEPVSTQIMMGTPPDAVRPYVVGERWREYYSQTYDLFVFGCCVVALAIVVWRVTRKQLWRPSRSLDGELATVMGAWALPTVLVLFYFYSRAGNLVTRYCVDMYPAFAAAMLCVGIALVDEVRARAPGGVGSAQLAIAGAGALYMALGRGWATGMSSPVDQKTLMAHIADVERHSAAMPSVPDHFKCNEPRGPQPIHEHLEDWQGDCYFHSGMVFAMPHSTCLTFTFTPGSGKWGPPEEQSLAGFRATGDFDALARCSSSPQVDGDSRKITMCDPHKPPFLLDGMRLYSIASLDDGLVPIDRLKLQRIDPAPACP